jgi:hypothetical protein
MSHNLRQRSRRVPPKLPAVHARLGLALNRQSLYDSLDGESPIASHETIDRNSSMPAPRVVFILLAAFGIGVGIISAQTPQQTAAPKSAALVGSQPQPMRPETFTIGQSIDAAAEMLRRRGIEFHEGFGDVIVSNDDLACLNFRLDADHTSVELCFSKTRRTITGLRLVFYPSRLAHSKSTESNISAQALFLYPDTTYAVHFSKPASLEELDRRDAAIRLRKSEYPNLIAPKNP